MKAMIGRALRINFVAMLRHLGALTGEFQSDSRKGFNRIKRNKLEC